MTIHYLPHDTDVTTLTHLEAIVNTVNCVGVMGKGVALAFKNKYPGNYNRYRKACGNGEVVPGKMFVTQDDSTGCHLINFPTKKHWKDGTKVEYILEGLRDLKEVIIDRNIKTIALPPLGCGNGGMKWRFVHPTILKALDKLACDIYLIPIDIGREWTYEDALNWLPSMSRYKAHLLYIASRYLEKGNGLSYRSLHYITYFTEVSKRELGKTVSWPGYPMVLKDYTCNSYGPYSDEVAALIPAWSGTYIHNLTHTPKDVCILPEVAKMAHDKLLNGKGKFGPEDEEIAVQLVSLLSTLPSELMLEIAASVHWVMSRCEGITLNETIVEIRLWGLRNTRLMHPERIHACYNRLVEHGFLPE